MTDDIQFIDEPPKKRNGRPSVWDSRLAALKVNPGQWARFGGYSHVSNASSVVREALRRRANVGMFEFTCRTEDGGGVAYVRYIGHPDDER